MTRHGDFNQEPTKQFTPRYCASLYRYMLRDLANQKEVYIHKWKRDVLLILLEKSLTKIPNRTAVRKKVIKACQKIEDDSFKIYK